MKRILAVVIACLAALVLLPCLGFAQEKGAKSANDQRSKPNHRSSSDSVVSIKDQRRVALVIGNSDYKVGPLQNPGHDAEDISRVLQTLGFAVQTKINADHPEMEEAINEFVQEIQNGDVALFYFSGHGVQVRGENYLIPIGGSIKSETDVRFKTLNAALVLGKMEESRNRTNIVILDACRNNPFKSLFRSAGKGLSKIDAPKGTFIAYATAPDSVAADGSGRNSPYTKHLMESIKLKGTPIEQSFKLVAKAVNKETGGQQIPWTSSSLLEDFYFYPSSAASLTVEEKTEKEQEVAKLREAERAAALEKERLEKAKREHELEIARLREAERTAALEKEKLERQRLEAEAREREQELKKIKEAQKLAALEKERLEKERQEAEKLAALEKQRFEKEKQELLARASPPEQIVPRAASSTQLRPDEIKALLQRAENGDVSAQYDLGTVYKDGLGVDKNPKEALKWYALAAEYGDARAQFFTGSFYLAGKGATKNVSEGLKWLERSAEQDHPEAQMKLANVYLSGADVKKDISKAQKWYSKAAALGSEEAEKMLQEVNLIITLKEERERAKEEMKKKPAESAPAKRPRAEGSTASSRVERPAEQTREQPTQPRYVPRGPGSGRWSGEQGGFKQGSSYGLPK